MLDNADVALQVDPLQKQRSVPVIWCRLKAETSKDDGGVCLGSRLAVSSALPLLADLLPKLHQGFDLRFSSMSELMPFRAESLLASAPEEM